MKKTVVCLLMEQSIGMKYIEPRESLIKRILNRFKRKQQLKAKVVHETEQNTFFQYIENDTVSNIIIDKNSGFAYQPVSEFIKDLWVRSNLADVPSLRVAESIAIDYMNNDIFLDKINDIRKRTGVEPIKIVEM